MNVFFDTNVVLDVLAERRPFYLPSAQAWALAESGRIHGLVSAITFPTVYYLLDKWAGPKAAHSGLRLIRSVFRLVPCDEQIIQQALEGSLPDFEDALQFFSAVRAGADCILTRNADHFPQSPIPVRTPAEFIGTYLQRHQP